MGIAELAIGPVASLLDGLLDRIFPDKVAQAKERQEFLLKAQELDMQLATAQAAINQQEASSSSIFIAGWRPFVGWICGIAFAYNFVVLPFMLFFATLAGKDMSHLPQLDMGSLLTVLLGMLGLGTMRTAEKITGCDTGKVGLPWQKKGG